MVGPHQIPPKTIGDICRTNNALKPMRSPSTRTDRLQAARKRNPMTKPCSNSHNPPSSGRKTNPHAPRSMTPHTKYLVPNGKALLPLKGEKAVRPRFPNPLTPLVIGEVVEPTEIGPMAFRQALNIRHRPPDHKIKECDAISAASIFRRGNYSPASRVTMLYSLCGGLYRDANIVWIVSN